MLRVETDVVVSLQGQGLRDRTISDGKSRRAAETVAGMEGNFAVTRDGREPDLRNWRRRWKPRLLMVRVNVVDLSGVIVCGFPV